MRLTITTNFPDIQRQLNSLRAEVGNQATARALNRTVEIARTRMIREITGEYRVKASFVRERLQIRKAIASGAITLEAALAAKSAKGRSANVIAFGARQVAAGVSVKIRQSGGRKTIKGAFIGNKGRTVFARVAGTKMQSRAKYRGTHAEKIKPVQTIDVAQMFQTRRINSRVIATIRERFPEVFAREVKFALSRFGK
jgi:hypothetical protein